MPMRLKFSPSSIDDYRLFLKVKSLPRFRFMGDFAEVPDEYTAMIGGLGDTAAYDDYRPVAGLFDYQRDIAAMAIHKRKFAVFADCGLGKTLILLEFARYADTVLKRGRVLIVSPLMVVKQTMREAERFYGRALAIEHVHARDLAEWLKQDTGGIGITNYDALDETIPDGNIGCLILDESSMLKSHYGKWGTTCIRLGRGVPFKLCLTGTPAPNDRIEFANHAVFLDQFPTTNSFLARFFVNRGQTDNRWELKAHALQPFYRDLSHWSIFLTNPATYGWKDNCATVPPIHVHIEHIELTEGQREGLMDLTGCMFAGSAGGITSRSKLGQLAKGRMNGQRVETNKPAYIRKLVDSWPNESTIIWCHFNDEQEMMAETFPEAANIAGDTPMDERMALIDEFLAGRKRVLISKPKILGFGLNLQIATRQVFSGLQDSYEQFYQAVKRSNRIGSTRPLNVHIPVTELEVPMIETVLRKSKRVQQDTEEQEAIFRKAAIQHA